MDKKNTTIGVILLLVGFVSLYLAPRPQPPVPPPITPGAVQPAPAVEGQPGVPATAFNAIPAPAVSNATFAALANDNAEATITTLGNDYVELRLTDFGGAIRDVAFKKYAAVKGSLEPFIFNRLHAAPILALDDFPGLSKSTRFELVRATSTEVIYRAVVENNIEVTRRYVLRAEGDTSGDPYRIRHETTFRNLTAQTTALPRAALNLGTTSLIDSNDVGQYLNVATYDGEDAQFVERGDLESGFLSSFGIGNPADLPVLERTQTTVWASVKNQFFASVFTPEKPGVGVTVRRIELPPLPGSTYTTIGLTGAARFDLPALPPGASTALVGELYVGPKEYTRLDTFAHREDLIMQFNRGMGKIFLSGIVAPTLNKLMKWTNDFVSNWGIAIILMTILLKVISLPFTLAASKSAKRMQKLQPLMLAVNEKYKDNPQKKNQAVMEIFKEHKVNPAGGCIPILITIPLFIGFFTMLQGTSELRFQSFLWAHDLSAPDTVARIFGLPLNIMPLLMGVTMYFQMKLTPSPTMDNMQAKIFKLMPFFFTAICYNFSCALALYSTINGLFTIGQQIVVNKYTKEDPTPTPLGVPSGTGKGGKKIKNVTPPKK